MQDGKPLGVSLEGRFFDVARSPVVLKAGVLEVRIVSPQGLPNTLVFEFFSCGVLKARVSVAEVSRVGLSGLEFRLNLLTRFRRFMVPGDLTFIIKKDESVILEGVGE